MEWICCGGWEDKGVVVAGREVDGVETLRFWCVAGGWVETLWLWGVAGGWIGPLAVLRVAGLPEMVWRSVIGEGVRGTISSAATLLDPAPRTSLSETLGPLDAICHGDDGVGVEESSSLRFGLAAAASCGDFCCCCCFLRSLWDTLPGRLLPEESACLDERENPEEILDSRLEDV